VSFFIFALFPSISFSEFFIVKKRFLLFSTKVKRAAKRKRKKVKRAAFTRLSYFDLAVFFTTPPCAPPFFSY